jgi:hypothetical protein
MDLSEDLMIKSLDEIIRRAALRFDQGAVNVSILREGGRDQLIARENLAREAAALDALKIQRARYDKNANLTERKPTK